MTNDKPENNDSATKSQESPEEASTIKLILDPPDPSKQYGPINTPPTPLLTESKEDPTWKLILRMFHGTKIGMMVSCVIALFILSKILNPGIFGARSYFCAISIAFLIWEYIKPRHLGEMLNKTWIAVILAPTLVLLVLEANFLMKQQEATELTQEISGNPNAWAECQRFTPALFADSLTAGFYAPSQDKDRSVIQYIYCKEWGNFVDADKNEIEDFQILWALGTVIHEAVHVSGERDEAVTQCLTKKAFPKILKQYGVSDNKIKAYTHLFEKASENMPSNYLRGVCEHHPLIQKIPKVFK